MDEREFDHINVIPLVDIMLVLLTIVLTTCTLVATGAIPIQLPRASAHKEDLLKMQTIEIDKSGTVYLNSVALDLPALFSRLGSIDVKTPILIRADKALALQTFVNVLDVVKNRGFVRVGLQTETSK
ncbi:MAG TPA: biopolymer transporter ExbD [Chitinivibrionales bacterium]|nr:biopolymer transporter ExbD [Chitinivibrionales bacterium]